MNFFKTLLSISALSVLLSSCQTETHDHSHSDHSNASNIDPSARLEVRHPHAMATIPGINVASGYMRLHNSGTETITLVGAESPYAAHVEFHSMVMQDSKMAMRKIEKIEIKPGESFELAQQKHHLMFMNINKRFVEGETVSVSLMTDSGETFTYELPIMSMAGHDHH